MKLLNLIIGLFITNLTFSQTSYDSLKMEMSKLNLKVENINLRLNACHAEYKDGLTLALVGIGLNVIGGAIYYQSKDMAGTGFFIGIGSISSLVGTIQMIDSHKYLK